jgi:hypothetical protein
MGKLETTIKKIIKEELSMAYDVVDRLPIEKDKFDKYSASIPTLDEFGVIIPLTDSRRVHCVIVDFGNGVRYGSVTDGGGDFNVFDISSVKSNGHLFNKFKKEIEKHFDTPIMDVEDCRKRFKTYTEKRFVNKD